MFQFFKIFCMQRKDWHYSIYYWSTMNHASTSIPNRSLKQVRQTSNCSTCSTNCNGCLMGFKYNSSNYLVLCFMLLIGLFILAIKQWWSLSNIWHFGFKKKKRKRMNIHLLYKKNLARLAMHMWAAKFFDFVWNALLFP